MKSWVGIGGGKAECSLCGDKCENVIESCVMGVFSIYIYSSIIILEFLLLRSFKSCYIEDEYENFGIT